ISTSPSKTSPKLRASSRSTAAMSSGRESCRSIEVTPPSEMPQGTMSPKCNRSVLTFSAKPWLVCQRPKSTPIAPIFSGPVAPSPPTHPPGPFRPRPPRHTLGLGREGPARPDHRLFESAHVSAHVVAIGRQGEDGVADHLPGSVVGDVSSPVRLEDLDALGG